VKLAQSTLTPAPQSFFRRPSANKHSWPWRDARQSNENSTWHLFPSVCFAAPVTSWTWRRQQRQAAESDLGREWRHPTAIPSHKPGLASWSSCCVHRTLWKPLQSSSRSSRRLQDQVRVVHIKWEIAAWVCLFCFLVPGDQDAFDQKYCIFCKMQSERVVVKITCLIIWIF
jgi:hypothetical protein